MQSKRARLDRFIAKHLQINRRDVKPIVAKGRVLINGNIARDVDMIIDEFTQVELDDQTLQANTPIYIMLNKPKGCVSATTDKVHKTVIDYINVDKKETLHIVGRLDFNSSGLILLTNDSRWSRKLMTPASKVEKVYRVKLTHEISPGLIEAFKQGMYFDYENITTLPAKLKIIRANEAEVTLTEGKYHQIKRMFGRFQNKVIALHRVSIGNLKLDLNLNDGESRYLTPEEVLNIINLETDH